MDEAKAREILGFNDGKPFAWGDVYGYVCPEHDDDFYIDGNYSADEIEAILWFARNSAKHPLSSNQKDFTDFS